MDLFWSSLLNACLTESQKFHEENSLWDQVPISSSLAEARFSMSIEDWVNLARINFKRLHAQYGITESPTANEAGIFEQFVISRIQEKNFSLKAKSWAERQKEVRFLVRESKRLGYDDLQKYLDSEACPYKRLQAYDLLDVLEKKAPKKKEITASIMNIAKEFGWVGSYFDDSEMGEGALSYQGKDFDFQFFTDIRFGFSYQITSELVCVPCSISNQPYPIRIPFRYESLVGISGGDWDLVTVDSIGRDMEVFKRVLARLLDLLSSSLGAAKG